jgi:hypothetical protein
MGLGNHRGIPLGKVAKRATNKMNMISVKVMK